ncbi:MAG TPA: hypothetical protein VGK73_18090 [Polyangiaceae bacterium]
MPRVASDTSGRGTKGFAAGNLVAAVMLSVGLFALPVRYWLADVVVVLSIAGAAGPSVAALIRPALAPRALRIAALSLLTIGLLVIAAAALSLAFLSGVHGDYGRGGVALMTLVSFLVLPYTVVYPVLELLWLHQRGGLAKVRPSSAEAGG